MFEWIAILSLSLIIVFLLFSITDTKKLELDNKKTKKELDRLRFKVDNLQGDSKVELTHEEI